MEKSRKSLKGCEVYFSATFSWTSPLSDRKAEIIVLKCEQTLYLVTICLSCWAGGVAREISCESRTRKETRGQRVHRRESSIYGGLKGLAKSVRYKEVSIHRGSFSYILLSLLVLGSRKSFVIPRISLYRSSFIYRGFIVSKRFILSCLLFPSAPYGIQRNY